MPELYLPNQDAPRNPFHDLTFRSGGAVLSDYPQADVAVELEIHGRLTGLTAVEVEQLVAFLTSAHDEVFHEEVIEALVTPYAVGTPLVVTGDVADFDHGYAPGTAVVLVEVGDEFGFCRVTTDPTVTTWTPDRGSACRNVHETDLSPVLSV